MGMDVYGKNPASEAGEYFRNNVWWWHPLADYIQQVAPEIAGCCQHWHSNDSDGLRAKEAEALATKLQAEIDAGRTEAYARVYTSELERQPNVDCSICAGTGIRPPVPAIGAGDQLNGGIKCNGCGGEGHIRPHSTNYPFSVENVQEFVNFLRVCGGFEIC